MRYEIAIDRAHKLLKKNDIKSALIDSELLLSKAINRDREFIILNLKQNINEVDYVYFQKLVNERLKGKPIAYITGKKYFWKYEFKINDKVLIPRPDTEIIIEQVLRIYKKRNKINFLDIGFGSGCILLSIF
jgi:release factor glutamine methyltransferase